MTRTERATFYALRLKEAHDEAAELRKIRSELDGLVFVVSQKPLDSAEKIAILKEVRSMLAGGKRGEDGKMIVEASDNTGTLDIIDTVINDLGGK